MARPEVFSWIDPDTGEMFHFDVAAMQRHADAQSTAVELIQFPIEHEHVQQFLQHRHIDVSYARRLTLAQLRRPMLGVLMPDETTLSVDGHHRMVRLHELEVPEVQMHRFEWAAVQPFLLEAGSEFEAEFRREIESP